MIEYEVLAYEYGSKYWRNSKGQLHREGDKPAYIHRNGYKEYRINGKLHRESGPAVITPTGRVEYWLNGEQVTKEWHKRRTQKVLNLTVAEIEAKFGQKVHIVKETDNTNQVGE